MKKRTLAIFLGLFLSSACPAVLASMNGKRLLVQSRKPVQNVEKPRARPWDISGQKRPAQKRRSAAAAEKRVENLWDMT